MRRVRLIMGDGSEFQPETEEERVKAEALTWHIKHMMNHHRHRLRKPICELTGRSTLGCKCPFCATWRLNTARAMRDCERTCPYDERMALGREAAAIKQ